MASHDDIQGSSASGPGDTVAFTIGWFAPRYYPEDVEVSKKRNLNKNQSMCEGEYVEDLGGKNREIKARGYVRQSNLPTLHELLNSGRRLELVTMNWSGEVLIKQGVINGPKMFEGGANEWLFEYNLTATSTARDEPGETNYGIVNGADVSPGAVPGTEPHIR